VILKIKQSPSSVSVEQVAVRLRVNAETLRALLAVRP
jgi:hypothetical protein